MSDPVRAERRAAWIPVALTIGFMVPAVIDRPGLPFVFGLPLHVAWCIGMVLVTTVALAFAYHWVTRSER